MTLKMHGSNTMFRLGLLTIAFCLLIAANSEAATLYWNPTTGGSGTWDTSSTLWGTAWSGSPTPGLGSLQHRRCNFSRRRTGTITVGSGIQVHNIIVGVTVGTGTSAENANNYTLSGGNITLGGTAPNVIGVSNAIDTLTINSTITGTSFYFNNTTGQSSGSTNMGAGTLIIGSNNSSTLSGTVYVGGYDQGSEALRITNSNALGTAAVEIEGHTSGTAALPARWQRRRY